MTPGSLTSPSAQLLSSPPWNFLCPGAAKGAPFDPREFHTPLERSFSVLIRGSLPQSILDLLQGDSSLGSPTSPLVERVQLEEISGRLHTHVSCPLRVVADGKPLAVMKPRQREPGSKAWQGRYPERIYPKCGCTPGTGPFMEVLAATYMQEIMGGLEKSSDLVIVPKVAYVQWGHPNFCLTLSPSMSPQSSPVIPNRRPFSGFPVVRGTGSLHEFIPNKGSLTVQELERLDPFALEIVAVLHLILLNADGHEGNLLVTQEKKIVVIDMAYILSNEGKDGGIFCWERCASLQRPPSPEIQNWIQSLAEHRFTEIALALQKELHENLQKLTEDFRKGEMIEIEEGRFLTHRISLCFLKKAIAKGWTLSQVGNRMRQHNPRYHGGLVYEVFQEIKLVPEGEILKRIDDICHRKALELPPKREQS